MQYNLELNDGVEGHSRLNQAEALRQSETDPSYQIYIWSQDGPSWNALLTYRAPRSEPVLSGGARTDAWLSTGGSPQWSPSMLWMPGSGPTLLTTNAEDGQTALGAVARADGAIEHGAIWVYMRE